jgi:CarboxypepD_reg-like domain
MNRLSYLFLLYFSMASCSTLQQASSWSKYKIAKIERIEVDSNKAIISGFVREDEQNEPIYEGCVVIQNTVTGTLTDLNGFFKLTLKPGEYRFIISYSGFHLITTRKIKLLPNTKTELNVKLHSASIGCG